ncbi:MAG: hypothetical protein AAB393_05995, partial [Bacteroidota bacterium]
MIKTISTLLILWGLPLASTGVSGDKVPRGALPIEAADITDIQFTPKPMPIGYPTSFVGSLTGLTGFWDYQTNGGACKMIRVNSATGAIHVVMMVSDDSAAQSASRRTAYGYSTNNGATWNLFNNMRVPDRRSGYPFLDLGQGGIDGGAIIANHSIITGSLLQPTAFVDYPAGGGAFSELAPPPVLAGTDEP